MAKEVNEHVKTTGVGESKRDLDEFGRTVAGAGEKTEEAGRKGGKGMEELDKGTKEAKKGLFGLVDGAGAILAKIVEMVAVLGALVGKFSEWYDAVKKVSEAK